MMLDCSTPAETFAANGWLHDHLTQDVPEEDQRAVRARASRRSPASIPTSRGRKTLMNWDEIRVDRRDTRWSRSARTPSITTI